MREKIKNSFKESIFAVLPISIIVTALCFTIAPISISVFSKFMIGVVMLILGMSLFSLGAETSMETVGSRIGSHISSKKNIFIISILIVIIGAIVVFAEPDLLLFSEQIHEIPTQIMITTVAIGSGVLLSAAFIRIVFNINIKYILMVLYGIAFALSIFVPKEFWAIAFDAGGVATGAISVPFIVALGAGATSIRSDKNAESDSFGLLAICSIGPVIAVMILGLLYNVTGSYYGTISMANEIATSQEIWAEFKYAMPEFAMQVATSLLPIAIIFLLYRIFAFKMTAKETIRIFIGMIYTFIGLVLFLVGANIGFMPTGKLLGEVLANSDMSYLIVPISMLIGYFMVKAEPAVMVLVKQISDITDGAISEKLMMVSQEIGLAIAIGLAMVRIIFNISILWILVPCYLIAFVLSYITPNIFTSIAFDSGGVASGTMTAVFLIPFSMGICQSFGGNILVDAFGIVAIAAAVPVICIQIVGLMYKHKVNKQKEIIKVIDKEEIIELEWMWANE